MKETASPFSPVTRAIQEKEKSDRTLQQGESLPKLAQLLKTHETETVSVSFPILNYFKPLFLIPSSVQFLFHDCNKWWREGLPHPNDW